MLFQNRTLARMAVTDAPALWMACSKQLRNQATQGARSDPPLGLLEDAVVGVALPVDLGGYAVEPLPGTTRAGQAHVRDGPGDAAPVWRRLKPPQERVHSTGQQLGADPPKGTRLLAHGS